MPSSVNYDIIIIIIIVNRGERLTTTTTATATAPTLQSRNNSEVLNVYIRESIFFRNVCVTNCDKY